MSKKKKHKSKKLDEFHYHEAVDRCYMLTNQVDEYLLEHPVVQKHKNLKKKVDMAITLLAECYQEIGGLEHVLFDKKEQKNQ